MKTLALALAALFLPGLSHAVSVANCPKAIDLKLSNLSIISAEQLKKELAPLDNEDGSIEAFRALVEKLERVEITVKLDRAANARCQYIVTKNSIGADKGDELVLATSRGKDWIRFRLHGEKGILGGYISVTKYAVDALEAEQDATLGNDDFNHPGNFYPVLGHAKLVEAR